jgi:hypothetical protein
MLAVMLAFWHESEERGGPARASGNTKEVRRESKHKNALMHPVRHMRINGDEAYMRFLQYPPYLKLLREECRPDGQLRWQDGQHVSRIPFLNSRCFCIRMVSVHC